MPNIKLGGILLAAGGSTRLGQPKQLLSLQGKTLVERTLVTMQEAIPNTITVVTGGSAKEVSAQIEARNAHVAYNPEWETGMASSIKTGLNDLLKNSPDLNAIIICLCDQPFLTSQHLIDLQNSFINSDKKIIASLYNELESVPALFDQSIFPDLLALKGQEGARKVIRKANKDILSIPFSKGIYDVDTPDAWEKIQSLFSK